MVVYTAYNLSEAHIVAGRLEVEGIRALVHRQVGAGAIGITFGKLGEVSVVVRASDYEQALAILDPDEPESLPDSTDDIIYTITDEDDDEQLSD